MNNHRPPQLDMTLEGDFIRPPRPPILGQVLFWALIIAVIAAALAIAAFALWLAMLVLPVALGAGMVAYCVYRFQLWRARQSIGGQRNLWRP